MFVAPGSDLHLSGAGGNPALDSGLDLSGTSGFDTDIDGDTRPAGAWDRGADEYVAGPTQVHYRWRNDDADEAAATWAAGEDTALVGLAKGVTRRLRLEVSNEGTLAAPAATYELQVAETATCSAGTSTAVPTDSSGHWQIVDSTWLTDAIFERQAAHAA